MALSPTYSIDVCRRYCTNNNPVQRHGNQRYTPYTTFRANRLQELQTQQPSLSVSEACLQIGREWSEMTERPQHNAGPSFHMPRGNYCPPPPECQQCSASMSFVRDYHTQLATVRQFACILCKPSAFGFSRPTDSATILGNSTFPGECIVAPIICMRYLDDDLNDGTTQLKAAVRWTPSLTSIREEHTGPTKKQYVPLWQLALANPAASLPRLLLDDFEQKYVKLEAFVSALTDEVIFSNGFLYDPGSELSISSNLLLFGSHLVPDPLTQINFAAKGSGANAPEGHGRVRFDSRDRDGIMRSIELEKVYLNRNFRFHVLSRAEWFRQGGSFLDAPGASAAVLPNGAFVAVPPGRPSLVTKEGYVFELQQMKERNTRLLWLVPECDTTMPAIEFGVPTRDPTIKRVTNQNVSDAMAQVTINTILEQVTNSAPAANAVASSSATNCLSQPERENGSEQVRITRTARRMQGNQLTDPACRSCISFEQSQPVQPEPDQPSSQPSETTLDCPHCTACPSQTTKDIEDVWMCPILRHGISFSDDTSLNAARSRTYATPPGDSPDVPDVPDQYHHSPSSSDHDSDTNANTAPVGNVQSDESLLPASVQAPAIEMTNLFSPAGSYAPPDQLDTSSEVSTQNMSMSSFGSLMSPDASVQLGSDIATGSGDRFILRLCSHAPECHRSVTYGNTMCLPCSTMDPQSFARGCRNCLHPPITGAVVANINTPVFAGEGPSTYTSADQASAASTHRPRTEDFHTAVSAAVQQLATAEHHAATPDTAAEVHNLAEACRRLSFSPDRVHQEIHENRVSVAAIPLCKLCSRCEQPGHTRPNCRNPCSRCGCAWPECDIRCPMKFDQSTELLACANYQSPPVQTTDLDQSQFELLPVTVAATYNSQSALSNVPDKDVIEKYDPVLKSRYLNRFPKVDGMLAKDWLTILDNGQLARVCRAVGHVELTLARFAVKSIDGLSSLDTIQWDEDAQAQIRQAYYALRDVVFAVHKEIEELLAVVWSDSPQ